MKVDFYTKAVLTVIAACLVWICVNGAMPVASAQAGKPEPAPTPVMLVDARGTPLFTSEGFRVTLGPRALPVAVTNASVPVNVDNASLPVAILNPSLLVQVMREPPTQRPIP